MNERIPSGIELIGAERVRQISAEGWTPEHDDELTDGSLAMAAGCYAQEAASPRGMGIVPPSFWPWAPKWWKPKTPMKNLVRAGALIAAEIDRRIRAGETLE